MPSPRGAHRAQPKPRDTSWTTLAALLIALSGLLACIAAAEKITAAMVLILALMVEILL